MKIKLEFRSTKAVKGGFVMFFWSMHYKDQKKNKNKNTKKSVKE